jgi:hypothetical protein
MNAVRFEMHAFDLHDLVLHAFNHLVETLAGLRMNPTFVR